MISKYFKMAALTLLSLQLVGCYTDYGPVEVVSRPIAPVDPGLATLLKPGERVKITVYGEEGLTAEFDISPSGNVSMPLIGTVKAAGQTPAQLGRIVQSRYRSGGFLQDPHVNVAVVTYKPFYVLGEAANPGEYPFRGGLTVHSAVAMAGGFTYRASRSAVLIRHIGDDVWREYSLTEPVPIAPGDLIRIPERYF